MIPNPIRKVLSTFQNCEVRALLMGGQACVLYGAAEFSRDTDFAILADAENLGRLERAAIASVRPLLQEVPHGLEQVEEALEAEQRAERARDRAYWEPLKRELEMLRHRR